MNNNSHHSSFDISSDDSSKDDEDDDGTAELDRDIREGEEEYKKMSTEAKEAEENLSPVERKEVDTAAGATVNDLAQAMDCEVEDFSTDAPYPPMPHPNFSPGVYGLYCNNPTTVNIQVNVNNSTTTINNNTVNQAFNTVNVENSTSVNNNTVNQASNTNNSNTINNNDVSFNHADYVAIAMEAPLPLSPPKRSRSCSRSRSRSRSSSRERSNVITRRSSIVGPTPAPNHPRVPANIRSHRVKYDVAEEGQSKFARVL